MMDRLQGDSDADFDLARRAVDLGWVTREQVEVALLEIELLPDSRLLNHLPLTPEQLRHLESPAPALPPNLAHASADPARRIAQYVLTDHHSTGGMGRVVKAWDTKLSRWVALKFLKAPDQKSRHAGFEEEARLAAGLSHPNIAAIYEIGDRDGEPFIAMQFIEGRTLSEARRGMKPREAARIMKDAALVVAFAHERGVMHRDLKPTNVMLDGGGRVFVMDFGLATQTEVPGMRKGRGTFKTLSGTPGYMAPEQARGQEADERSDIYGLGACLYELLTGRPPSPSTTILEVIQSIGKCEVTSPRKLNPKIEADLETITMKCLDRNPDRRYSSATRLADDIERFLNRDPILARPPSFLYRLRMKSAKSKMAMTAALATIALATVLGWWLLVGSPESHQTRQMAGAMNQMADAMKLWAEARGHVMAGVDTAAIAKHAVAARLAFESAIKTRESAMAQVMRGRCLQIEGNDDQALQAMERAYQIDRSHPETRLELAKALIVTFLNSRGTPPIVTSGGANTLHFTVELLPDETEVQKGLRQRGERLLAEGRFDSENAELLNGLLLMGRGHYAMAADALSQYTKSQRWDITALTVEAQCRLYAKDFIRAVASLDLALVRVPSVKRFQCRAYARFGLRLYPEALSDHTKSLELDPGNADVYVNRGVVKKAMGALDEAIADFTTAIGLNPNHWKAYSSRGLAMKVKGLPDAAIADFTKSVELNPRYATAYYNRGMTMRAKGLIDKAIEDHTMAITLNHNFAEAYNSRGVCRRDKGLNDEAIMDYSKAIELNPSLANAYYNRGLVRKIKGLLDEAIADQTKAIELDPREADPYTSRGIVMALKGRLKQAIVDHSKAIELDPKNANAFGNRGIAYAELGQDDEAIADFKRALELAPPKWPYRLMILNRLNNVGAERLFRKGLGLLKEMKYREAIENFKEVVSSHPNSSLAATSAYNVVCAYSLLGENTDALDWLEKAIDMGWKDLAHVERDSDLNSLRGEERYKKLVARLKAE